MIYVSKVSYIWHTIWCRLSKQGYSKYWTKIYNKRKSRSKILTELAYVPTYITTYSISPTSKMGFIAISNNNSELVYTIGNN